LPDELAAVPADDTPAGVYAVRRFPYAAEDGLVSGPPVGVGVGGDGHGYSRYRGTARHLTTPAGQRRCGPLTAAYSREMAGPLGRGV
jgi:hypothetical protein